MKLIWLFIAISLLIPRMAWALTTTSDQQLSVPPNTPTLVNTPDIQHDFHGFKFSSYTEVSANYLVRDYHFISAVHDRLYDIEPNGFTIQQLAFTLAKQPAQGFGGLLNVIAGRDANSLTSVGMNPNYFGIQNFGADLTQLFLQYAYSNFTFIAGKFNALAGIEDNSPVQNANFSHSYLNQFAQPGTVLGVRGIYVVNSHWSLALGLNNGWDIIDDTSRQKTLEAGIIYQPNTVLAVAAQVYSGEQPSTENTALNPSGKRNAFDIFATLQATDKLSFAFNYDYVTQNKATLPFNVLANAVWTGITGYVIYQFNERWYVDVRGELFADSDGYTTGVRQSLKDATLTLAYSPMKHLDFRAETRHDFSNVQSYRDKNSLGVNQNQQSFALEGIYKF